MASSGAGFDSSPRKETTSSSSQKSEAPAPKRRRGRPASTRRSAATKATVSKTAPKRKPTAKKTLSTKSPKPKRKPTSQRKKSTAPSDKERIQNLKKKREEELRKTIDSMDLTQLREFVGRMVDRFPSAVLDLMSVHQRDQRQGEPSLSPRPPTPPDNSPGWCVCHHCVEMPTDLERRCCQKRPEKCISRMPEFELYILDAHYIQLANQQRADMFALNAVADNKSLRHGAYRLYTYWQHGRLGEGNRRVIPSCCVQRIRNTFPDQNGHYTGYMPSRLI